MPPPAQIDNFTSRPIYSPFIYHSSRVLDEVRLDCGAPPHRRSDHDLKRRLGTHSGSHVHAAVCNALIFDIPYSRDADKDLGTKQKVFLAWVQNSSGENQDAAKMSRENCRTHHDHIMFLWTCCMHVVRVVKEHGISSIPRKMSLARYDA